MILARPFEEIDEWARVLDGIDTYVVKRRLDEWKPLLSNA